jgi:thiol-disulfide isomerase/thioredoxin
MIQYLKITHVAFIFFFSIQCIQGQNIFHVLIQKPAAAASKNFRITYDNGIKIITVTDTFKNNKLAFSDTFYSKLAVVEITYSVNDSTDYSDTYFAGTKPARIVFAKDAMQYANRHFIHSTLENVTEISQNKTHQQRLKLYKHEAAEINDFRNKNGSAAYRTDSLKNILDKKLSALFAKYIDFIKINGTAYYSFWFFRTQIIPRYMNDRNANIADFTKLLSVYNTVFPYAFKTTIEGKKTKELLTGRINTRKNYPVPGFEIKDIEGNLIRLEDLQGKYVLIDFWASWCPPCMKERPFIKEVHDKYASEKLVIISISNDVNYDRFKDAIKENKMNWINIFGNENLSKEFGVAGIPATFLIDKKGILIFDSKEEHLEVLGALLDKM